MRLELSPKSKKKTTISIYISENNLEAYEKNKGNISSIAAQLLNFFLAGKLPLIDIPKIYEEKFFSLPNHEEILNQLVLDYCQGKIKLSSMEENVVFSKQPANQDYQEEMIEIPLKKETVFSKQTTSSEREISNELKSEEECKANNNENSKEQINLEDMEDMEDMDDNSEDFNVSLAFPVDEMENM